MNHAGLVHLTEFMVRFISGALMFDDNINRIVFIEADICAPSS